MHKYLYAWEMTEEETDTYWWQIRKNQFSVRCGDIFYDKSKNMIVIIPYLFYLSVISLLPNICLCRPTITVQYGKRGVGERCIEHRHPALR